MSIEGKLEIKANERGLVFNRGVRVTFPGHGEQKETVVYLTSTLASIINASREANANVNVAQEKLKHVLKIIGAKVPDQKNHGKSNNPNSINRHDLYLALNV